MARLSDLTSSEASEPTSLPRRLLGTAVNLSTIIRARTALANGSDGWTNFGGRPERAFIGSRTHGFFSVCKSDRLS